MKMTCQHTYSFDKNKKCPYPGLYKKWVSDPRFKHIVEKWGPYTKGMYLQKEKVCLFHSKDASWKESRQFLKILLEMIKVSEADGDLKEIDMSDVIITNNGLMKLDVLGNRYKPIDFHNRKFTKRLNFHDAKFLGVVDFADVRFEQGANFSNAYFQSEADFQGARFEVSLEEDYANFEGADHTRS